MAAVQALVAPQGCGPLCDPKRPCHSRTCLGPPLKLVGAMSHGCLRESVQGMSAVRWQGTMDVCVHIIAVRSCFNHAFNVKTCFNHAVKDTERLFYRRPRAHDADS